MVILLLVEGYLWVTVAVIMDRWERERKMEKLVVSVADKRCAVFENGVLL